jgi:hypothetical protein
MPKLDLKGLIDKSFNITAEVGDPPQKFKFNIQNTVS